MKSYTYSNPDNSVSHMVIDIDLYAPNNQPKKHLWVTPSKVFLDYYTPDESKLSQIDSDEYSFIESVHAVVNSELSLLAYSLVQHLTQE